MDGVDLAITIRDMEPEDAPVISDAFTAIGWDKPVVQYERYYVETGRGERDVLVAWVGDSFAGYGTVVWESNYAPFRDAGIPEIVDLNVLPAFRRRGVASRLVDEAESRIARRSRVAGIAVGMYPDYGPAQRMYVVRGYVPDGRGLCCDGEPVSPLATVTNDDSLNLYLTRTLR
jgi:GNAT superfamily N-acetyltransferase